ncbi:MAG: S9 family peptidase [candidate division Zixibacteria bacterium]|nr:S9 family peptidase [candidate division Zixibacteria bacterium]
MRRPINRIVLTLLSLSLLLAQAAFAAPPETKMELVTDTLHGVAIPDSYRWLEDQKSPATRDWLTREMAYTESFYPKFTALDGIKNRLTKLLRIDRVSAPFRCGQRYFFTRRNSDQELWTTWCREGKDGKEQLLLDPHTMSKDFRTSADMMEVSDDGKIMAYTIRQGGQDETAVHFRNIDTGADLPDVFPPNVYFGMSITKDGKGCYYVKRIEGGASRAYYHEFGQPLETDKYIFGEGYGPEQIVGAGLSEDRRTLMIQVSYGAGGSKSELFIKDATKDGPIVTVVKGVDAIFSGTPIGDKLYIQTNLNAPNWKVMVTDLAKPTQENWRDVVPEAASPIEGLTFVGGKIFVNYLEDVVNKVKIFGPNGEPQGELALPGLGSGGTLSGRWDDQEGYYSFTTFNLPGSIYKYDIASGKSEVWFKPDVPFQGDNFEVKQVWYNSKDGTKVPMFLAYRKGLVLDGNNPTYLTGYGGFNVSSGAYFSSVYAIWMEAGGVVASPALRGGGEFGEKWHKDGMLDKKQNVFDDFIGAAEWLIANKYTNPKRLAIMGGSNGGLLVGAMLTQRPDLFKAIVCWNPLLDMLRYHRLLMGPYWISEYGSADSASQFSYLRAYSPYQNVKKGVKYPSVMFISGDGDTRVDPMHARKMTALMQATVTDDTPILLYYDMKSGHVGTNPLGKTITDNSIQLAYVMWQLGVEYPAKN